MIETELKINIDRETAVRLGRPGALAELRVEPQRVERLVSVYYDTPDSALAAARVSLRLRRVGRRWVQTIKRPVEAEGSSGLFANRETERPAPGGRLVLEGEDSDGALAAVRAAADGAPLAPVFETRVERVTERLRAPGGGEVELALDAGEIRAGEARAQIREAELELKSGEVGDIFGIARTLFPHGPVRFASANKSARGYRLAETGIADAPGGPRKAGDLAIDGGETVERVATRVFRDCLAQIAANIVVVCDGEQVEGPHQLRIGLRRLRTAFSIFGASLGTAGTERLSQAAKALGQVVGELRDTDVLIGEVVADAAREGLDDPARDALVSALDAGRVVVRARVRAELAGQEATGFLFDLGAHIEGRGWLLPSDHEQTARLAAPIAEVAPSMLDKRLRTVLKSGRRIEDLDAEGLHTLRKKLKKLRYAVDALGPVFRRDKVAPYLKRLKELQDSFGNLNDATMARAHLLGSEAPARGDPEAQRAVGWTLGVLAARVADTRPGFLERWERFRKAKPFWR